MRVWSTRDFANRPKTGKRIKDAPMKSIAAGKTERAMFVFCNLALAIVWLHFCIRLIRRWSDMPTAVRDDTGLFFMFFTFWWLTLIHEKRGFISLLMAGGVFMTVFEIVKTFM